MDSTIDKYHEAVYFLKQMELNYHSPNEFRFCLNAFVQAFRNITFMLQSEAGRPAEFEAWYTSKQEEMKACSLLRNLVDARNQSVKRSMLLTKSEAESGLFRGRRTKLALVSELNIFEPTTFVLARLCKVFTGKMIDEQHSAIGEQLGIKRTWIVDTIGDTEIIGLCIKALELMGCILHEASKLFGVGFDRVDLSVNMEEVQIVLESDVDPTLPDKWGW